MQGESCLLCSTPVSSYWSPPTQSGQRLVLLIPVSLNQLLTLSLLFKLLFYYLNSLSETIKAAKMMSKDVKIVFKIIIYAILFFCVCIWMAFFNFRNRLWILLRYQPISEKNYISRCCTGSDLGSWFFLLFLNVLLAYFSVISNGMMS